MNENTIPLIVLSILIVVFTVIYFLFKRFQKNKANRIGQKGEKTVSKVLKQIARKNHWKLINDLYLPLYDKTTQIDHLLIGPFGVAVIETKALAGEIYGNANDQDWVQIIGEEKRRFYNPLLQNKAHIDCVQHILKKEKIYRVNIDSLVVFSAKRVQLAIPSGMPVISWDLLKKYFKKSRYQKDNEINPDAVFSALLKHKVTDSKLLKQHNQNVKEMANNKH